MDENIYFVVNISGVSIHRSEHNAITRAESYSPMFRTLVLRFRPGQKDEVIHDTGRERIQIATRIPRRRRYVVSQR